MNKKVLSGTIQLKQNNRKILRGVVQNDTGVILDIRVMDGLTPFDFSGYGIVTLKVVKPDESVYVDSDGSDLVDTINARSGRFKIGIPASLTAQKGMHYVTVGFGDGNNTYFQTVGFNYFVGEDATIEDSTIRGSDEYPILTNLINQFSNMSATLAEYEQQELDRRENELERQETFAELEASVADALARAERAEALLGHILSVIEQAGVPITIDYSDIVLDDDLATALASYSTTTQIQQMIEQTYGLPQIVIGTTAPTDTSKIWLDTSGGSSTNEPYCFRIYIQGNWVATNVAVYG